MPECCAQVCEAAVEAKVDVLVLCDTNGGSLPWEVTPRKPCDPIGAYVSTRFSLMSRRRLVLVVARVVYEEAYCFCILRGGRHLVTLQVLYCVSEGPPLEFLSGIIVSHVSILSSCRFSFRAFYP